jgi:hypothetical protein
VRTEHGRPRRRELLIPRVRLPEVGSVGPLTRLRLTIEVVMVYATLVRVVRSDDLPAMVKAARAAPFGRITVPPAEEHATAIRLGQIVGRVFRVLPMDSRCLIRSLVLIRLLERRSIPATLQVGVKTSGDFGAHAWVEHDDIAVLPTGHVARLAAF